MLTNEQVSNAEWARYKAIEARALGDMNDVLESALRIDWPDPVVGGGIDRATYDAISEGLPFQTPQWPPYATMEELCQIRDAGRLLATYNEFAIGALRNRVNFIVGWGHAINVTERNGEVLSEAERQQVEAVIDAFKLRNHWAKRQRALQWRLDRDGEVFLRFFAGDAGLSVRFVDPEDIEPPTGRDTDYPFGIQRDPRDAESVLSYSIKVADQHWEQVESAMIQHRKIDDDFACPRGVPLLFASRRNLGHAAKLLRNVSIVSQIQSAIAMIRRHKTATLTAIQSAIAGNADVKVKDGMTGKERDYTAYPPGKILDASQDTEYQFPHEGLDPSKYIPGLQAQLRAVAASLVMPEFMLSADASNANYASTMVAEGPSVRAFEAAQQSMIEDDREILLAELRLQEKMGRLPAGIAERIELVIEAQSPAVRNQLEEAQVRQLDLQSGVLSVQTGTAESGRDYETEQANMEAHRERVGDVMGEPPLLPGEKPNAQGNGNRPAAGGE